MVRVAGRVAERINALLVSPLGNLVRYRFELAPGRHRHQLDLGGALQVIQIVPCLGDGRRGNDHPVILQKNNVGITHDAGNTGTAAMADCLWQS